MTRTRIQWLALLLIGVAWATVHAAVDITGRWTAAFETQIGMQEYTYQFRVKGRTLTGKAASANGETDIQNGRVDGNTVTFLERFPHQGMTITITYMGTIVSADEIKFTRRVGEFATEEFVVTRVTP